MKKYLGEEILNISESDFKDYEAKDFALIWIERYGQIDGDHHKAWVLDQVSRILNDTKVIIKKATWDNGDFEYRFVLDEPSEDYKIWVDEIMGSHYYVGIAP